MYVLNIPSEAEIQLNSAYSVIPFVPMAPWASFVLCFVLFAHIGMFHLCLRLAAGQHIDNHM